MIYILPALAVILSFVLVLLVKPKKKESFKLPLAFSGAFLLALTIFELLPEAYKDSNSRVIGVLIMLGILFQIFLEFLSKGAEHGHIHFDSEKTNFPWSIFISLSVHSLLEGIPIEKHHTILYGILIHKIAIAVILSIFLIHSKIKLSQSILFVVLFSLMTPLGSYMSANFELITKHYTHITALVIGVLLHISTVILFESSKGHSFNLRKVLVIIIGITIAYFL